jgi:hypothetical protein
MQNRQLPFEAAESEKQIGLSYAVLPLVSVSHKSHARFHSFGKVCMIWP